ncbi:MAG: hypothetical protein JWM36_681 [Hyphomicrobiales bacterium]|nr:hypothetical protein [Hyphomicrobiales bacterium]
MLFAIRSVRDLILEEAGETPPFTLQAITSAIQRLTRIDEVIFVGYECSPSNPIWGQFQRWDRRPSVYSSFETIVEIRYALHMSDAWRRFVVVKELCHALDRSEGSHTVTDNAVGNLIGSLALRSSKKKVENNLGFHAEIMAEASAIELLCPLPLRKRMLQDNTFQQRGSFAVAELFGVPEGYLRTAFDPEYLEMIEALFDDAG